MAAVEVVVADVVDVEVKSLIVNKFNKSQQKQYIPSGLLFQWHITERCNLRCSHCYQENYSGKELSYQELIKILERYNDLLNYWRKNAGNRKVWGHITITGGEPFVRKDFFDLLEVFSSNNKNFSFAILTNGTFIDENMAHRLSRLGPSFVQVSIEGTKNTHDKIRGNGNFDKTVTALKNLVRERIRTLISFTAHRGNYKEFTDVARLGMKLKVSRVWADRLIPWGSGSEMKEQLLTPNETREFFEIMYKARNEAKQRFFSRTEIAMHRALQFLVAGGMPYHCTAGDTLITVQPNGDMYPCRRMPIRVGNLLETPLIDLYYESKLFNDLRNRQRIINGCRGCIYIRWCRGGLKCLSYALTEDPFKADPGCWLATKENTGVKQKMVST